MSYLVDTDWIIDYLTDQAGARATLSSLRPQGLALSSISLMELYEGVYGSRDPASAEAGLRAFLHGVLIIPVDELVALEAARIRLRLRQGRRPIANRAMDLIITATAIVHDMPLLTRNRKDYEDLPELAFFDDA